MKLVKCVVWDLDGTVWPGVAIESGGALPEPFPAAVRAIAVLEERGIANSVASRTDPVVRRMLAADPDLARRFVAPQLSWGHKSEAIRAIAARLGIATAAIAFVDDDPFERGEVAAVLPDVLVLSPQELYARLDTPAFRPAVLTADGRRRVERYREAERREAAARGHGGTSEDFLRSSDIRLRIGSAVEADVDRIAELIDRTHRFNTTGEHWDADQVRAIIEDPGWFLPVARLTDRFGAYGLIGAALVELPGRSAEARAGWRLRLFSVSCRAVGRGVPGALLGWIIGRARSAGAPSLLVDIRPGDANLELRVLLRGAGFTLASGPDDDGLVVLARPTGDDPPAVPWLTVEEDGGRGDN